MNVIYVELDGLISLLDEKGGKMDEKEKNPNFYNCTNSANVLDIERCSGTIERASPDSSAPKGNSIKRSNVANKRSNV